MISTHHLKGLTHIPVDVCYTKGPLSRLAVPPPTSVRRRMERNRQKLVGRDKGSLTEQQREQEQQ